jgi:hypothetical protein
MPDLEILHTVQFKKEGVVSDIRRTMRGLRDGVSEIAVATYKGLYFGSFDSDFKIEED